VLLDHLVWIRKIRVCHSLTLSSPENFQPLLVSSSTKRIGISEALRGVRFAIENFIITAQEIRFGCHRFYRIGHRQREFRHLRHGRFIASDDRSFIPLFIGT
jgi:hypothetical protein